ncbi:Superoxide dismutase [Mn], mitochondrial [Ophidiomyces ophidiicola]|nr:Superoxide dismutase [Mn], mitochondrial [Ophidiomyces ophidiicola]KAI1993441.1 Superoxide dismutase [Mn], mitochondrial [Ophidiomyces ophidiicola]KAI1997042.1 Superoxide dismutase [Mn], mitochondrial [Ophidiomyces ophidiicola]KAI2041936.1 Superoxide dismutase [Mn], mitochondrial [Ophidiomyces ophidiicola]KAI2050472.1 Superoxide dismutase [Mn], mitochondrial [Ophidiomyces ophidiicola]
MAAAALRPTFASNAVRASVSINRVSMAHLSGITSSRCFAAKATLPDLPYDYSALEPSISGKIMELHHKKHHQTYVNSYNDAVQKLAEAQEKGDIQSQVTLQQLTNFHGGGHINHSLFWENLAPSKNGGGEPPSGPLAAAINKSYGNLDEFKKKFNAALAGIQGSGWGWLVKDKLTGDIAIQTYANQNPVAGQFSPLLGIDAWEHAYYLQYENRKAEYFGAVWDVVNWKEVEKRFTQI